MPRQPAKNTKTITTSRPATRSSTAKHVEVGTTAEPETTEQVVPAIGVKARKRAATTAKPTTNNGHHKSESLLA